MSNKIFKVLTTALSFILSGILVFNMSVSFVHADEVEVQFPTVENIYIGDDNRFHCSYDGVEYRSSFSYSDSDTSYRLYAGGDIYYNIATVYRSIYWGNTVYDIRNCVLFDTENLCFALVKIFVESGPSIPSVIFHDSTLSIFIDSSANSGLFGAFVYCEAPYEYAYGGFSQYYSPYTSSYRIINTSSFSSDTEITLKFNYYDNRSVKSLPFANLVPIYFYGGDFWDYYSVSETDTLTNLPMGAFMFNYIFWDPDTRRYSYLTSSSRLANISSNMFIFSDRSSYKLYHSASGDLWTLYNQFGYSDRVLMDTDFISTDHNLKLVYSNDTFNVVNDESVFPDKLSEVDLIFKPLVHSATGNYYYDYDFAKESFERFYSVTYMGLDTHNIYTVYFDGKYYTYPGDMISSKTSLPNSVYMTYGTRDVNFTGSATYFVGFSLTTLFSSEVLREECVLMDFYECWGNRYYFGYLTEGLNYLNKSILSQYDTMKAMYDRLDYSNYLISENKLNINPILDGLDNIVAKLDDLVSLGDSGSSVDLSGVDSTLSSINTKLGSILGFIIVDDIFDDIFNNDDDPIIDVDDVSMSGLYSFLTSTTSLVVSGRVLSDVFSSVDTSGMVEASSYISLFWSDLGPFQALVLIPVSFSIVHLIIRKEGVG